MAGMKFSKENVKHTTGQPSWGWFDGYNRQFLIGCPMKRAWKYAPSV